MLHLRARPMNAQPSTPTPSTRSHRQAHAILRLREVLFELQCAPEPDPVAIDALMARLARVRARRGDA